MSLISAETLAQLYESTPVATCLFMKDEEARWSLQWQNVVAQNSWGEFDISQYPELKIELMDALASYKSISFSLSLPEMVEPHEFVAIPLNDQQIQLQFFANKACPDDQPVNTNEENFYKEAIEASGLGLFDWNITDDRIRFNQQAYDYFGLSKADSIHSYAGILQCVCERDVNELKEAVEEHLETGWPLDIEFRIVGKNGQWRWLEFRAKAQWVDSKPTRMLGTLRDISERKHAELQVKQREALIEKMIDALPMSIYVKDAQGCYRFFNDQAERQTNLSRQECLGRTDYEVYPMPQAVLQAEKDNRIQQSEELQVFEGADDITGDNSKWYLHGKVPIKINQPNRDYETWLLSFALDISQRKQMEEELKEARSIAEQAAKDKADFLSVMSHEIRTPLNSVIGNAGLLLAEELDATMTKQVDMIKRSGEHLLYLINDILDLSKLEAGKVELDVSPFNLRQQVETVLEMSHTNADLKGIYLKADLDNRLAASYLGDDGRIRQILLNLVSNAIKFTSEGGVTLKIKNLGGADNAKQKLRFEVSDTGIGIAKENIGKLFAEYSQAESSTQKNYGGTGLGLSISKKLVEAMQGEIGIESELGKGSTFWFELPLGIDKKAEAKEAATLTADEEQKAPLTGLNILVAEDNLPNQFLIKSILTKLGHAVTIANDGVEAFDTLREKPFDIVLMDMQMPRMDGMEATRKIRAELPENINQTPVIALTANAYDEVYQSVIEVGMNDCLTKPINLQQLKLQLAKWAN